MTTTKAPEPHAPPEATPDPVRSDPPPDRFCDLLINGGVASGVVYPWAIVELARHYRLRNIGGASIGAVAAAVAAASEYGRCTGVTPPFEVLRRVPEDLAEERPLLGGGKAPRMLALFQPSPRGLRLWKLFVDVLTLVSTHEAPGDPHPSAPQAGSRPSWIRVAGRLLKTYAGSALKCAWPWIAVAAMAGLFLGIVVAVLVGALFGDGRPAARAGWLVGGVLFGMGLLVSLVWAGYVRALLQDLGEGVVDNGLGFCRGLSTHSGARPEPAFVEWMHEGIQKSAGRTVNDRPLSFSDLWLVERPGVPAYAGGDAILPAEHRAINLELMVTDVTRGRPFRLPLSPSDGVLYFRFEDWSPLFPQRVMQALRETARPYRPRSPADPGITAGEGLFEMPVGDLPIIVAARMSMSFPVIFAPVPVWAVDYEAHRGQRVLRPCRIADGGICSNFPIHLFDAAVPRWPTFGLWLAKRLVNYDQQSVWLPRAHLDGRAETWMRFEPATQCERPEQAGPPTPATLAGFLLACGMTLHQWSDRTRMLLPTVRNRVARLALRSGEGQLHIAMPREMILGMAHEYGTSVGRELVKVFAFPGPTDGQPGGWREHQYVRLMGLVDGLHDLLDGFGRASNSRGHGLSLDELIDFAEAGYTEADGHARPLAEWPGTRGEDGTGARLPKAQADALRSVVAALRALEPELAGAARAQPYRPQPEPELRLRPHV